MKNLTVNIKDGDNTGVLVLSNTNLTPQGVIDRVLDESGDVGRALQSIDEEFLVTVTDSSVVESIGYNFHTKVMEVELTSGVYKYEDVPAATFLLFVSADSKGVFFNKHLRNRR